MKTVNIPLNSRHIKLIIDLLLEYQMTTTSSYKMRMIKQILGILNTC